MRPRTVNFAGTAKAPPVPQGTSRAWSSQQDAIFAWFATGSGNLVVRARAGTGKTTTIVEGVTRAPERQILLAAFNKTIATELQSRVASSRVECKTLHSLGLKYVRRNWKVEVARGDERGENLARRAAPDAPEQMLRLVRDLHTRARELAPLASRWEDVADVAVRFNLMPDPEWEDDGWTLQAVCEASLRAMTLAMEPTTLIDFADMIFLPIAMRWIRPWFDMVVVDEAQDMTGPQLLIARGACRRSGRVVIVGDDRQAIYAFRGADSGSLDRLKAELGATELGLTTTYRCGSLIVDLAKVFVPDYAAAPGAMLGEIVTRDEEDAIAEMREGDFLISRTNAPLVRFCMRLLKEGKRAKIRGRDIGKGIISLLRRLKASTVADVAPALETYVDRELSRASKLPERARDERCEFVRDQQAIVLALLEGAATVQELETRVNSLFDEGDGRGAIWCSTVHRAKGLEAERTFLVQSTFRTGRIEEDNLRYVAITRAKARLCWVKS